MPFFPPSRFCPRQLKSKLDVTFLIILFLRLLDKKSLVETRILIELSEGVHRRIGSPIPHVRKAASVVAEKFSSILDPSNPLKLDPAYSDALQKMEAEFSHEDRSIDSSNHESIRRAPKKKKQTKLPKRIQEDPDELFFAERFRLEKQIKNEEKDEEEEEEENEEEEEAEKVREKKEDELNASNKNDEDYDNDLKPYDLNDDESDLAKVKPPKYLKQVIQYLRSNSSDDLVVEKYEQAIKHCESLIRNCKSQQSLDDISPELCRVLLYTSEDYSIENFDHMRMRSLIALAVHSVVPTVTFLTTQFYSENCMLGNRIRVLDVLCEAAQELADIISAPIDATKKESEEEKKEIILPTAFGKSRKDQDYDIFQDSSKTRVWGKIQKRLRDSKNIDSKGPKPNRFAKNAGIFYYPLVQS